MPISKIHVVRFFQLLKGRKFAEAERVLERIKEKTNSTEWNSGYILALDGVLLAQKTNDTYAYSNNLNFEDEKNLKTSRKEFLKEYKNKVHTDFDRGFFAAWSDYMLISTRDLSNTKEEEQTKEIETENEEKTVEEPQE